MKLNGEVTTGLGKAAFFLSQDFYVNNFLKNCGFKPYPGTLNVIVPGEYLNHINEVKNNLHILFHPDCHRRFWNLTKSTHLRARGLIFKITTGREFHLTLRTYKKIYQ